MFKLKIFFISFQNLLLTIAARNPSQKKLQNGFGRNSIITHHAHHNWNFPIRDYAASKQHLVITCILFDFPIQIKYCVFSNGCVCKRSPEVWSWLLFHLLKWDQKQEWLLVPCDHGELFHDFRKLKDFVLNLLSVNGIAERDIKLISDFKDMWKDPTESKYLTQCVEEHRRVFPGTSFNNKPMQLKIWIRVLTFIYYLILNWLIVK